jgi:hypothetical protein
MRQYNEIRDREREEDTQRDGKRHTQRSKKEI